jgi:predicted transcriptional regulator
MSNFKKTKTVIDKKTGEVLSDQEETVKFKKADEEPFHMIFHDKIELLFSLSKTEVAIFQNFCQLMVFSENKIELTSAKRKKVAKKLGISKRAFDNSLCSLKKNGFVLNCSEGELYVNPKFAYKGKLQYLNTVKKKLLSTNKQA